MTTDCNMYSCTQLFKYNTFNYLYVNVSRSAGSSSTPWSVDDQTNPGELPAFHKESILPPTKLEHPDTEQLGPSGNSRVPNRPHPHTCQVLQPPQIQLSKKNHAMVSQEVQELLIKGAIVEFVLSPASFISQILLVEEDKAGSEGCIPPDYNSLRPQTPPLIHLGGETLQAPVSPLQRYEFLLNS